VQKGIGILYCGGCNPHFDRVALVEKIQALEPISVSFEHLQRGKEYDAVLVVFGCSNSCASLDGVTAGKIIMIKPMEGQRDNLDAQRIINLLLE